MARIVLNKISIRNKLVNGISTNKRFKGLAYNAAKTRLTAASQEALRVYDSHVVTEELRAGAKNEDSVLGYGNLVAFLGLSDGDEAAEQVRNYLNSKFNPSSAMNPTPKFTQNNRGVSYTFEVEAPSLREIYDAFPAPDNSYNKSWVAVIETGMGNFSYFVFNLAGFPKSRSGTGLQREKKRDWIDVNKSSPQIRWVSEVIETFLDYFDTR